jgi:hypothetical protein
MDLLLLELLKEAESLCFVGKAGQPESTYLMGCPIPTQKGDNDQPCGATVAVSGQWQWSLPPIQCNQLVGYHATATFVFGNEKFA